MSLSKSFLILPLLFFIAGCKGPLQTGGETVDCPEAVLCVRNNSSDQLVIYSWNSSVVGDTIFPGECATATFSDVHIEYDAAGNVVSSNTYNTTFQTNGAGYSYQITECEMEVEAPGGYWNPKQDCDNGVFEPWTGELDTDCGGYCNPCPFPNLGCSPQADYIDWDLFSDEGLSSSGTYEGSFSETTETDFTFDGFGYEMKATYNVDKLPNKTRRFVVGNLDHQISIRYNRGWGFWYANEGQDVYIIKREDGTMHLVFCDLEFTKDNVTATGTADLNINL
ncbi:MAG TPA: hypothetical protein DCX14_14085 [Flavobacteriales bacterium]|nr:hypothetical protein [Flavobacteriales bacterium]